MPARIPDGVWANIKSEYLRSGATRKALAARFNVSVRAIDQRAKEENWKTQRQARALVAVGVTSDRIEALTTDDTPESLLNIMTKAIAALSKEMHLAPTKSKEGCANALVNMVKAQRELFPPSAEELAKIAAELGIRPADFIRALQKEWNDRDAQVG